MQKKEDIKPDIKEVPDRGETIGLMEPMLIGESSIRRGEITVSEAVWPFFPEPG